MKYLLYSELADDGEIHYFSINEHDAVSEVLCEHPELSYEGALEYFKDKHWAKEVEIENENES